MEMESNVAVVIVVAALAVTGGVAYVQYVRKKEETREFHRETKRLEERNSILDARARIVAQELALCAEEKLSGAALRDLLEFVYVPQGLDWQRNYANTKLLREHAKKTGTSIDFLIPYPATRQAPYQFSRSFQAWIHFPALIERCPIRTSFNDGKPSTEEYLPRFIDRQERLRMFGSEPGFIDQVFLDGLLKAPRASASFEGLRQEDEAALDQLRAIHAENARRAQEENDKLFK